MALVETLSQERVAVADINLDMAQKIGSLGAWKGQC